MIASEGHCTRGRGPRVHCHHRRQRNSLNDAIHALNESNGDSERKKAERGGGGKKENKRVGYSFGKLIPR